jgi:hypothetical protein
VYKNYHPKGASDLAKVNKSCRVCSTEYSYCPACDYKDPSYKQIVCSENCYKIWNTLSRNGVGLDTTQETIEALELIPMPSTLQPGISAHINRLWLEIEIATAPVVEEVLSVDVIEESPVVIEPIVAPKKKKKVVEPVFETIEVVLNDEV